MGDDIVFERHNHIGIITLQRMTALNALTLPMIMSLYQQLERWQSDREIHAVLIQSALEKAFCAGGDVRWLYEGRMNYEQQMQFFWHEYRLNYLIYTFSKPYIALMDGVTMGGGVGISLHGSHAVASERFVFSMPETGIGLFPDIGASYLLSRCPDNVGIYLGLTGNRLRTHDAKSIGLIKHQIASSQFPATLDCLLNADLSMDSFARVDACLQKFAASPSAPEDCMQTMIKEVFSCPDIESMIKHLEHMNNLWSKETLTTLRQKSPLSLNVTLRQLKAAANLSLGQCLQMDYNLVSNFMGDHDFYEGVRALLVDKDKSPHWQPATLAEVQPDKVIRYFERTTTMSPLSFDSRA